MKKVLVFFFLVNSLAAAGQVQNDVDSASYDAGSTIGFYGIPIILLLVVGFLAYRFLFKRKKPIE